MRNSGQGREALLTQSSSKAPSILKNWMSQCGNTGCSTRILLRAFTHRHRGVTIENDWYCGTDCLEQVVGRKVREVMTAQHKPTRARSSRVPLGLLLLSRGVLTSEQLKLALEYQRSTQLDFGDSLQKLGFATQQDVTAAVAAQWACPVFHLGEGPLEVQVRIPRPLLEQYEMLPVHYSEKERRLLIGFVRNVQHQALYSIGHITSCTVAPCFISAREYQSQLRVARASFLRDYELVFEEVIDTAEMARIITNYMVQLSAHRMRVGKCRDYVWARIWGHKQEMDLLFRVQGT